MWFLKLIGLHSDHANIECGKVVKPYKFRIVAVGKDKYWVQSLFTSSHSPDIQEWHWVKSKGFSSPDYPSILIYSDGDISTRHFSTMRSSIEGCKKAIDNALIKLNTIDKEKEFVKNFVPLEYP